ncbi:uncharacterized protein LOC110035847 [Phalaenopsis equestris]|uniref:uncharacterized protein LOC110035847 n=1 Tax=Phalaenopsis equestris TaxID=78828 RepID=UPI0009E1F60A|nr:uncharacterized protein LOC110035847 [Phalaenopsis equestris]
MSCGDNSTIRVVDGSVSKVAGFGSVRITQNILLRSVLHVPTLNCNLISIEKLTNDLRCIAKFLPIACEFQDENSGTTIDNVEMKGVRSIRPPLRYKHTIHLISNFVSYISNFVSNERLCSTYRAYVTAFNNTQVQNTIDEALKHPGWKAAINEEIRALQKNGTWTVSYQTVSYLSKGKKAISCKWSFKVKHKAGDAIERLKARLVEKDFHSPTVLITKKPLPP